MHLTAASQQRLEKYTAKRSKLLGAREAHDDSPIQPTDEEPEDEKEEAGQMAPDTIGAVVIDANYVCAAGQRVFMT